MDSKRFRGLCRLSDLPEGRPATGKVGSKEFLLLRRGEGVLISGNKCPHHGAHLSDGLVFGTEVVCPCHNARFDLVSGRVLSPPALDDIPVYHTGRRDDEILVGPVLENQRLCLPSMSGQGGQSNDTILIVGAGAAGNSAAETLRREGYEGKVLMLTGEPDLPYDRTALSKGFLSGAVGMEELPLRSQEYYDAMGIEVLTSCPVRSIEPRERMVVLRDGRTIGYDMLLLATGGVPRRLEVPGVGLPGSHYLRSRCDAAEILESLACAGSSIVVGAGFIGLEVASVLRNRGMSVQVVAPENLPMCDTLGEELGRWLQDRHVSRGVGFSLGRSVREIRGSGRVEEVVLSDGSSLEADVVIIGVGIEPAVDYLRGTDLVRDGAVAVDNRLSTALPGIYAAGDLAAVAQPGGKATRIEHWVEAERQGKLAAQSMLGKAEGYRSVPFFWSEQQGVTLKCVGLPAADYRRIARGSVEGEDFLVGFFDGSLLKAAVAVGRDRDLIAAGQLIRRSAGITPEQLRGAQTDLGELAASV